MSAQSFDQELQEKIVAGASVAEASAWSATALDSLQVTQNSFFCDCEAPSNVFESFHISTDRFR